MAQKNLVSSSLNAADKQEVLGNIKAIKRKLDGVLQFNLTPSERQEMLKMGDKTLAFVEKSISYAGTNPGLVPPYLNLSEAAKDYWLAQDMAQIARELRILLQGVEDTLMVTGSEAYTASLVFYGSVKAASRTDSPGSHAIYADLSERFPRKRPVKAPTSA